MQLKKFFAPMCNFFDLCVIPSQLHPSLTVKSPDMWARPLTLSKVPLFPSLLFSATDGKEILGANVCGGGGGRKARPRRLPAGAAPRGLVPAADRQEDGCTAPRGLLGEAGAGAALPPGSAWPRGAPRGGILAIPTTAALSLLPPFSSSSPALAPGRRTLSYGPPWAHYLGGYQDRLLGGPLGLPGLRYTAPEGVEHKDCTGVVLG
jgi:hypothetical protein